MAFDTLFEADIDMAIFEAEWVEDLLAPVEHPVITTEGLIKQIHAQAREREHAVLRSLMGLAQIN